MDLSDLLSFDTVLVIEMEKDPAHYLPILDSSALEVLSIENPEYAKAVKEDFHVRLANVEAKVPLRKLDSHLLGKLISCTGIVVRSSLVRSHALKACFKCMPYGHVNFVDQDISGGPKIKRPYPCSSPGCDAIRYQLIREQTKFTDLQLLVIQEMPEDLPAGQIPQSVEVYLLGDLVNSVRPGDRVNVTGIPEVHSGSGRDLSHIFDIKIQCNNVETIGKRPGDTEISREEEEEFRAFASTPGAYQRLIQSFAPSIYGMEYTKEATLLQTAGAPQCLLPDGTTVRGDISILVVGEPGLAKSQIAKFAVRVAPRAIYTTGRGSTSAGLCAAVVKDKNGAFVLEAGAMVLADLGLLVIDEFGSLRREDMDSLNEALEQQTASVTKAGISANLNARTSVHAIMNPIDGKYDPAKTILDNIAVVPIPLLTRFDLIFVVRDEVSEEHDQALGEHMRNIWVRSKLPKPAPLSLDFLKRYLTYCKRHNPVLGDEEYARLFDFYKSMRRMTETGGLAITPRWLEGLCRLALARARLLLHERVDESDVQSAISLLTASLRSAALDPVTKKLDIGILYNRPISEKGLRENALSLFRELSGPEKNPVEDRQFVEELQKRFNAKPEQAEKMFGDMYRSGIIYETRPHFFKRM